LYIALLRGVPLADGNNAAALELVRVGPVTYGSPTTPPGDVAWPLYRYIEPTAPVSITPPGSPLPGVHIDVVAWGLMTVSNGGTPVYVGQCAASLLVGVATSLPASSFRVFAEASQ
jgi:hypothetical protein